MKRLLVLFLLLPLFYAIPLATRPTNAVAFLGPGVVCIADPSSTTCPTSSATFTGPVGSQLAVAVNILNAPSFQPLNAFDIRVLTDPTTLNPASVDLTNAVFPVSALVDECVKGVGTGCVSPLDGPGVVRVHMNATGVAGTSGNPAHLFSIIYNIVGASSGTTIGYQNGCSPSSVPPLGNTTCVLVTQTPPLCLEGVCAPIDSETTLTATFINAQGFTVTASPASVTVLAGASASSTIIVTGSLGFTGTVNLSASTSPSTGLTCSLNPGSVSLSSSIPSAASALSCSGSAGFYTVKITGSGGGLISGTTLTYLVQDFRISASATAVVVNAGTAGTSTITVTPSDGFGGVVNLSANNAACSVTPTSVTGSGSATLSCAFASAGTFTVVVTGTSSSLSHSATVVYTVQDFTVGASPVSLPLIKGVSSGTITITATGLLGFTGTVTLTAAISPAVPHPPTLSSPPSITLSSITTSGTSTLAVTSTHSTTIGTYTVVITAVSGALSHSVTVTVTVSK